MMIPHLQPATTGRPEVPTAGRSGERGGGQAFGAEFERGRGSESSARREAEEAVRAADAQGGTAEALVEQPPRETGAATEPKGSAEAAAKSDSRADAAVAAENAADRAIELESRSDGTAALAGSDSAERVFGAPRGEAHRDAASVREGPVRSAGTGRGGPPFPALSHGVMAGAHRRPRPATLKGHHMDVTQTNAAPQTAAQAPATGSKGAGTVLTSDFETFLKMLTVQMRNQDPLSPMESTEFAVQLATFSGVEQQVKTNDLLTAMQAQIGVMGMSQLAGWIGMEARTGGPVWFDGAPIELAPTPAEGADAVVLIVRDADGAEVHRRELPASSGPITWTGKASDGGALPSGAYSFEVESLSAGTVLRTDSVESYAPVVEARIDNGESVLLLQGGIAVRPGDVTALRAPNRATS